MNAAVREAQPIELPRGRIARLRLGLLRPWSSGEQAQELLALYRGASPLLRAEMRVRLVICPFEEVEARVPRDARVLDLGCGYGVLANLIALGSPDRQVLGMDIEPARVRAALTTVAMRANICFTPGDVCTDPFDGPAPTCIVMNDVLHHIPHNRQIPLLRKCYAALPPGGLLLIKDVDKDVPWKYFFNYAHDVVKNRNMPFFCLDSAILAVLLDLVGFTVEVVHLDCGYPYSHVLYQCRKHA